MMLTYKIFAQNGVIVLNCVIPLNITNVLSDVCAWNVEKRAPSEF
jgi:hypothetical protein